jgi:rSAM-associated Gly-rich repeat protein
MLGGALALTAGQSSQAASMPAAASGESPLDLRVANVRNALDASSSENLTTGQRSDRVEPGVQWWRNGGWHRAWGNGGWRNWHRAWGNGGLIHINL